MRRRPPELADELTLRRLDVAEQGLDRAERAMTKLEEGIAGLRQDLERAAGVVPPRPQLELVEGDDG